ncbi:MAG: hypothetical protein QM496_08450 [Verrucomicrobiota bacterium]
MSALKSADDFPKDGEALNKSKTGMLKMVFLAVGVVGLVLFAILAMTGGGEDGEVSRQSMMAYSWLFAVMFFLTLAVGGIFWTLVHNATNSGWGVMVRRLMENLGSLTPWILLLGLPLVFCSGFKNALWEWIPEQAALIEGGEKYAKAHLEAEKTKRAKDLEVSKADFKKLETETAAALTKAGENKGEASFLNERLVHAKSKLAELEEGQLDDKALSKELQVHFMKHGDGEGGHGNPLLFHKSGYLNIGSWVMRYIFYVLGLGGVIYTLRKWSIAQDKTGDPKYTLLMRRFSCAFIAVFGICWTFLVVDWLMVLDYTWFSTMWGVYLFAGAALSSMALLIALLTYLRSQGHFKDTVTMEHYHLMGKLLHSFVIFWAYIAFSQFFLIWYANITEETKFFLLRNTDFFNTYTISLLVIGHFFIPFAALLVRQVKKTPALMVAISVWILLMQIADIYWIIIPERGVSLTGGAQLVIPGAIWFDVLAFITVGGIFGFLLLRSLGKSSLYPSQDPRLEESLNVVN